MNPSLVMILSAASLILPLLSVAWLWRGHTAKAPSRFLIPAISAGLVMLAFMAAPWGFFSYYLRYLLPAVFIVALCKFFTRKRVGATKYSKALLSAQIIVLMSIAALDASVCLGHSPRGEPVEMAFPLKSGTYYVVQGGDSRVSNLFHGFYRSINALDLVKLNEYGNRAKSFFPSELSDYEIFGDDICSPCDGTVTRAVNEIPDRTPHSPDTEHPLGNHVTIECKGVKITFAHMMEGSVAVSVLQKVNTGDTIGRVGNSGNSFEPHLHIHAIRSDDVAIHDRTVPLSFDGTFLSMNSVVEKTR